MMVKSILNGIRNFLLFQIRYPWVQRGKNVHCQWSTSFGGAARKVVLGNHVGIGSRCHFLADTRIGDKVLIADCVAFLNADDHRIDRVGSCIWDSGRGDAHRIVVEDDVWIGHGVIVLSGATIGRGAVVGAGAIVVRDVASYAIVAGVPARVIRMRFTPAQIVEHERMLADNRQ